MDSQFPQLSNKNQWACDVHAGENFLSILEKPSSRHKNSQYRTANGFITPGKVRYKNSDDIVKTYLQNTVDNQQKNVEFNSNKKTPKKKSILKKENHDFKVHLSNSIIH